MMTQAVNALRSQRERRAAQAEWDDDKPSAAPDAPPVGVCPLPDLEYRHRPVEWARDRLGIPTWSTRWSELPEYAGHTWDGTPDPLAAMLEAVAKGLDVAVESGTGTGKTFVCSWVPLWFLATREDALCVTTAPIEAQLKAQLWRYMGRHWKRFQAAYPTASRKMLRIRMADPLEGDEERWAIMGWGCGVDADTESATRAQGFHAPNMMVLLEETPGIPMAILNAFLNTSGSHHNQILAVGNPDATTDTLHTFAVLPGVQHIRVSSLDHPNVVVGREVIPGAISPKGVDKLTARWVRDTPMWASRVRGICPAQGVEALIRREWVDAAVGYHRDHAERLKRLGRPGMGVDVAQSERGDKACTALMRGGVLVSIEAGHCTDAQEYGTRVWGTILREKVDPRHCGIDSIGVGVSTVNQCNALAKKLRDDSGEPLRMVQPINVSLPTREAGQRAPDGSAYDWVPDASLYYNLRSQMYWQLREDLQAGRLALPQDEQLLLELVSINWRPHLGLVRVEEKDNIRKRLGRSPDKMDALALANWVRPRKALVQETPANPIATNRDTSRIIEGRVHIDRIPTPVDSSGEFSTFSHLGSD